MLFSIGHSNHSIEHFVSLLQGAGVTLLADVRSYPKSRYAPQFNREALEQSLPASGIGYLWLGKELGGMAREKITAEDFECGLAKTVRRFCDNRTWWQNILDPHHHSVQIDLG